MPHEILMKNTSAKAKKRKKIKGGTPCLSAINAINCSSAQARQGGRGEAADKDKAEADDDDAAEARVKVSCKLQVA